MEMGKTLVEHLENNCNNSYGVVGFSKYKRASERREKKGRWGGREDLKLIVGLMNLKYFS